MGLWGLVESVYRSNKERGYYADEPAKPCDEIIDVLIRPFERIYGGYKELVSVVKYSVEEIRKALN